MRIIIDGDACPSIPFIEKKAKEYNIEVIIFCDIHHVIKSDYCNIKVVDSGFQSVDMYVVNTTSKEDIVITQDYGVAALCLGKNASVISPKGLLFTNDNIDRMLEDRHIAQCIRKAGGRSKGHKKRSKEDDKKLLFILENEIIKRKGNC